MERATSQSIALARGSLSCRQPGLLQMSPSLLAERVIGRCRAIHCLESHMQMASQLQEQHMTEHRRSITTM